MRVGWRILGVLAFILLLPGCATEPGNSRLGLEAATAAEFAGLKSEPAPLRAFLRSFPKGGDLHSHLGGAIYAESYIAWAAEDGRCLIVATQTIVAPPCDAAAGRPTVAEATAGAAAYRQLIDALSTRNYALRDISGHDQFFSTYSRFGAAEDGRDGDMLAEVMKRAAQQNILYLELMVSPGMAEARALGAALGWDDDLGRMRARLEAAGLPAIARRGGATIDAMEARAREILDCDASRPPACAVTVRYIAHIVRTFPRAEVFAQAALAFELVERHPRIVGLNLVGSEDHRVSLADYSQHMRMIAALKNDRPEIPISLHAGELTLGLVPPEHLRFHIREAVEVAGARRIGHGVDLFDEDDPEALLALMAARGILVETNLTSNEIVLGVVGADHPFQSYRAAGVPVALSTDDEGVARIDLTNEYHRAALTYDLSYEEVKQLSRNSLSYAFLAGESLWRDPESALPVRPCADDRPGAEEPSDGCAAFLAASEKASLQWRLETAFQAFESARAAGSR